MKIRHGKFSERVKRVKSAVKEKNDVDKKYKEVYQSITNLQAELEYDTLTVGKPKAQVISAS